MMNLRFYANRGDGGMVRMDQGLGGIQKHAHCKSESLMERHLQAVHTARQPSDTRSNTPMIVPV